MIFQLTSTPLETLNLKEGLAAGNAGGFCVFEGLVRNQNDGKTVVALEYEAFEKGCQAEIKKIFQEVAGKFDIIQMKCVHRVGRLNVGEIAVWIGVTAAHRDAAFQACRCLIDEIKHRLPIWKKEFYINGDSGWVNCSECLHKPAA